MGPWKTALATSILRLYTLFLGVLTAGLGECSAGNLQSRFRGSKSWRNFPYWQGRSSHIPHL